LLLFFNLHGVARAIHLGAPAASVVIPHELKSRWDYLALLLSSPSPTSARTARMKSVFRDPLAAADWILLEAIKREQRRQGAETRPADVPR
jgi:hypothetical protein